jgi:hypothetical protein
VEVGLGRRLVEEFVAGTAVEKLSGLELGFWAGGDYWFTPCHENTIFGFARRFSSDTGWFFYLFLFSGGLFCLIQVLFTG